VEEMCDASDIPHGVDMFESSFNFVATELVESAFSAIPSSLVESDCVSPHVVDDTAYVPVPVSASAYIPLLVSASDAGKAGAVDAIAFVPADESASVSDSVVDSALASIPSLPIAYSSVGYHHLAFAMVFLVSLTLIPYAPCYYMYHLPQAMLSHSFVLDYYKIRPDPWPNIERITVSSCTLNAFAFPSFDLRFV
jgi:hypothetical protein